MYSWSKIVSFFARSCRTDSTSVMRDFPPRRDPRNRTLSRYSFQTGRSGTRSTPKMPPGASTRSTDASVAFRSDSLTSDWRMPYGAMTRSNRADARNGRNRMSPRNHDGRARADARVARACAHDRASPTIDRRRRSAHPSRATGIVTRPVPQPSSSIGPFARSAIVFQNVTSRRSSVWAFSQS